MQSNADKHRFTPAISKKIQRAEWRQGIVLADTKTARTSLADRLIGHLGYALNAFGLFARLNSRSC